MNRIENKFAQLKKNKRKAFIAFITAGYPNLGVTEKLILEFDRIGVDIIELGVPFSDPMADGPVIQEASQYALNKKTHLIDILNMVSRVRKQTKLPICLMTYYNPIFCFGDAAFAKAARVCGVDGVIIPDLPPEEGRDLINACAKNKVDIISFIAPTTSRERMKKIAKAAKGFIYYVSLTGTTGARKALPKDLVANLKAIKKLTKKPVCAGFGISTAAQVKEIKKISDGVIIGSAIVKKIKENIGKPGLVSSVGRFTHQLNV
ncbi:MAG: tryptophan synthase subunit alpha [Candidatus Omnitrophica bacterium]|nr:tryptophan synthase subunit alpha [Candidatus Omnitrophota bacterium]